MTGPDGPKTGTGGQLHQALDGTGAVAGSGKTFLNTIVLPEKY